MLEKLKAMFEGQRVQVIDEGEPRESVCRRVETAEGEGRFNMYFSVPGGANIGFTATTITDTYVEGETTPGGTWTRRIQLFPYPPERQLLRDMVEDLKPLAAAGVVMPTLIALLLKEEAIHGDAVSLESVCSDLNNLASTAIRFAADLAQKKSS